MQRTGTNGEWPMQNMRNGSQGFDDGVFVFGWFYFSWSVLTFLPLAIVTHICLPVVDCEMAMACF